MFYLHTSNRTENLLSHLAEVIRADKRVDLFAPELFLVQSQGMERIISQRMAEVFGVWCNFKYLLPLAFFEVLANRLGMSIHPDGFGRETLTWRLEGLLRDLDDPDFAPLSQYFKGENVDLKRFQLARQLANLFDQYQVMRPDLPALWDKGKMAGGHPAEKWQMRLWQRLSAQLPELVHRGAILQQVGKRLESGKDLAHLLPLRLSVFGLHIMPPLFLSLLARLSRHSDVHLYVLSPCEQYWGDLPNKRQQARPRLAMEAESEIVSGHPLLISLGRQGRDFQAMLLSQVDFELEFRSFDDPFATDAPTLLHRLQADMLHSRVGGTESGREGATDDGSLIIVSCHSRLREVAVLKDNILDWLHRDPALELRDIVVMAPDIQEYAALIPAVFHDLQHSIADRSLRRRNSALAAFLAFVDILDGRFGWMEVLDLLQKDVIFPRFELTTGDLEQIRQWVTDSGIRWGLSAQQRQGLGLPANSYGTWKAGLERLLMGYAIDSPDFVDGILPYTAIEGGAARALGGLCEFVAILADAEKDLHEAHSLAEWSQLLLHYADRLFAEDDSPEILELRQILTELDAGDFHQEQVVLAVVRAWLETASAESRSASGFLRGQLTFCSMLPMRSIPFRIVCLLGLADGAFPGNDRHATFDLLAVERRYGDRSKRDDDRYQFLEALLAARDTLYMSYTGQSIKSNDKTPPSVVVTELLEVLQDDYGLKTKDLVRHHPLQPFSRRYFSGADPRFFSYDKQACATARRMAEPRAEESPWWSGELAPREEAVPLAALFGFFANPQKWFVRNILGIHLDLDEDLPEESEPFAVGHLAAYAIDQEVIQSLLVGEHEAPFFERLRAEGKWPLGMPGELLFEWQKEELVAFVARIKRQNMGARLSDLPVDLEICGIRLKGQLSNVYEEGILLSRYTGCKGKDVLGLWLHNLLAGLLLGEGKRVVAVLRDRDLRYTSVVDHQPDLARFVELFRAGCLSPSSLYVEPAWAYAQQLDKKSLVPPLVAARRKWQDSLDKGYEPEWALLLQGVPVEDALGEAFEELCRTVFCPVWGVSQ